MIFLMAKISNLQNLLVFSIVFYGFLRKRYRFLIKFSILVWQSYY